MNFSTTKNGVKKNTIHIFNGVVNNLPCKCFKLNVLKIQWRIKQLLSLTVCIYLQRFVCQLVDTISVDGFWSLPALLVPTECCFSCLMQNLTFFEECLSNTCLSVVQGKLFAATTKQEPQINMKGRRWHLKVK